MFYVEHLLNIFRRSFLLAITFVLFGSLVFNYIAFRTNIETRINQFVSSKIAKPHFFGLVDKKINIEAVRRKLGALPGISGVSTIADTEIRKKVTSIISGLDEEMGVEDMDLSYAGLKVVFNPEIRNKGQVLLRNYLVRLTGEQNIILGPVLASGRQDTTTSNWIRRWGYILVLVSLSIFWLMLAVQLVYKIFSESKVVEKFKRTNYVAEKTNFLLMGAMVTFIAIPQWFFLGSIEYLSLGTFAMTMMVIMFIFNMKKWI